MATPSADGQAGDTADAVARRPPFIDDDECVRAFVELLDESRRAAAPDAGAEPTGADTVPGERPRPV
jgi:hypothetical protein